jgi:hypothetical protein
LNISKKIIFVFQHEKSSKLENSLAVSLMDQTACNNSSTFNAFLKTGKRGHNRKTGLPEGLEAPPTFVTVSTFRVVVTVLPSRNKIPNTACFKHIQQYIIPKLMKQSDAKTADANLFI